MSPVAVVVTVLAVVVLGVVLGVVALLARVAVGVVSLPRESPGRLLGREDARGRIAFLGASIVHGSVSANLPQRVARCLGLDPTRDVVNAGVNGDLAYNAHQRLPAVLALAPRALVVLVGSNDVMGAIDEAHAQRYLRMKRLPQAPSPAFYREHLAAIVAEGQAARVPVVLCTLPMLGEDLDADANVRVRAANAIVRAVADAAAVPLVDVHALLSAALPGGGRPFPDRDGPMLRAMVLHHALGWSFNRVAAHQGFTFLTDGIHLDESAADRVAPAIADALAPLLAEQTTGRQ